MFDFSKIAEFFGIEATTEDNMDISAFNDSDNRMDRNDYKSGTGLDEDWDMDIDEESDITWT